MDKILEMSKERDRLNIEIADLRHQAKEHEHEIVTRIFERRQYDLLTVKWSTLRRMAHNRGY